MLQAFTNRELCQDKKKCNKCLPPVQSITHLCNKFLLSVSFYQVSYGTNKPFIWRDGATIPSNKYGALKKCCPASATHIVHPQLIWYGDLIKKCYEFELLQKGILFLLLGVNLVIIGDFFYFDFLKKHF